ncbi:MAG: linked oxidase domain protein [Actinotalea sp.]|nr:linked oxidase domain protein [Actinotalea sp.]
MPTLRNWAGNHTYRAARVHEPTTVEELSTLVAGASRIRALGSRHCFNDLADSDELVLLDGLPAPVEIDATSSTVTVSGGMRYGTLAAHLHRAGWALANLASLPHISVAGAVATATHGSGDRHRTLSTAVAGLRLVTSDGAVRTLSREDPDLPGAVVSLGALGVVVEVTLDIEPTYDVVQHVHTGLAWDTVLDRYDEITASADSVSLFTDWRGDTVGQLWRKARAATAVELDPFGATAATVEMHPLDGLDPASTTQQLGVPGPWHERWSHFRMAFTPSAGEELQTEYFVPRVHSPAAFEAVRGLATHVAPLLFVSEIRTIAADDLWLSGAYDRDSVALHFTWQPRQPEVEALLPVLERALEPFAARPHWGKLFSPTQAGDPDRLEGLYPRLPDFRDLVARLDPRGAFRNDYLQRHVLRG